MSKTSAEAEEPAHTLPWAGSFVEGVPMIQLLIYVYDGHVHWTLVKLRPAHEWRHEGSRYWERRGEVTADQSPSSDREAISLALKAIQDRLGER